MSRAAAAIALSDTERHALESLAGRRKTAQGLENKAIVERLGIDANTVGKWRRRFAQQRLDGFYDEPRPGAPRRISDDNIAEVVRRTLEETPPDATHWSLRSMARAVGHAPSTIHRIWRAFGLQPHRVDTFKLSSDLDLHLVMDNYATHKTQAVQRFLAAHPRWHVHFTPTGASWLNQVERFFALLTDKQLGRGAHRSTEKLEAAIEHYMASVNADPRPFRLSVSACGPWRPPHVRT